MKTTLYKASSRGHANHGWLDTYHTFSFANYYNPSRINFGALRVINDDIVKGGKGFGTHPHDNMEIITIPLYGDLEHKDSMGNSSVIRHGEVQVMSAGTGVTHSEFNANRDKDVNLFQIWVFPNREEADPRYGQKAFDFDGSKNKFVEIVSPDGENGSLWIHQDAWFSIGSFDKGEKTEYRLMDSENGVFAMVIEGDFNVSGTELNKRDGLGIEQTDAISLEALSDNSRILLMEVPMQW
ncbi:MAG: pirin family protein [Dysgonomonas sp.]